MTQSVTDAEQEDKLEELTQCAICLDPCKDPRMLPCGHTFCLVCIDKVATHNKNVFECPFRDRNTVNKADINKLPVNEDIRNLVILLSEIRVTIPCCNCKNKNSEVWCRDCQNKGYCAECYESLHLLPALADHRAPVPQPPKVTYCSIHQTKELEYWCKENNNIYCADCLAEKQDPHKYEFIGDAVQEIAKRIKKLYNDNPYSVDVKIEVEKLYATQERTSMAKKSSIAEQFAALRKMIDDCEESVTRHIQEIDEKNVDNIKQYELKLLSNQRKIRERRMLFNQTLQMQDYVQTMKTYQLHENHLKHVSEQWCTINPPGTIEYSVPGLEECRSKLQEAIKSVAVKEEPPYENEQLQQTIAQQEKSTMLNLNNRTLTDNDMRIVAQTIRTNRNYTRVHLGNNQIKAAGARYLANALRYARTVNSLELWSNAIGDDGVRELVEVLRTNTTLTCLGLNSNQIGQQGAECLAELLQNNETLIELSLINNKIGDTGAQALVNALKNNKKLEKLQVLRQNEVSNKVLEKLTKADKRIVC